LALPDEHDGEHLAGRKGDIVCGDRTSSQTATVLSQFITEIARLV
jgi:hypothetical protein